MLPRNAVQGFAPLNALIPVERLHRAIDQVQVNNRTIGV